MEQGKLFHGKNNGWLAGEMQRMDMSMRGYHMELFGLKAPLKTGETVPLTLNIELADKRIVKIDVQAEIKPLKSANQK